MSVLLPSALHVAALPFPSPQGTQAAIARMLAAIVGAGTRPTLLTYEDGAGEVERGIDHVRARGARSGSLRSGPSIGKLAADALLTVALRNRRADVVVAHHVEAALATLAAGVRPWVFVAHTGLGSELPTYFSDVVGGVARRAGEALDGRLLERADAIASVSPLLGSMLSRASGRIVHPLPIPWPVADEITRIERIEARARLGIPPQRDVVLYAGNLDGYQGLDVLGRALERVAGERDVTFLLATESPHLEMVRHLGPRMRPRTCSARLGSEADRRLVHAAASVVLVPRRSPGGVPVKLLDALARGVPTVAVRRALAGHALDECVVVADDDDDRALAAALGSVLAEPAVDRARRALRGRDHIRTEHSDAAFLSAYARVLADALGGP